MGQVLEFKRRAPAFKKLSVTFESDKHKVLNAAVLHLMTQRNQPYGSERRCCEVCGRMIASTTFPYTDDPDLYQNPGPNYIPCIRAPKDKR